MHVDFCHLRRKGEANISLTYILVLFFLIFLRFCYIHINSLHPGIQISSHQIKHSGKECDFADTLNSVQDILFRHLVCATHLRSIQTLFSVRQVKLPRNILQTLSVDKWSFLVGIRAHTWGHAKILCKRAEWEEK